MIGRPEAQTPDEAYVMGKLDGIVRTTAMFVQAARAAKTAAEREADRMRRQNLQASNKERVA